MVLHVGRVVYETHAGDTIRFLNIMCCAIINALAASDALPPGYPASVSVTVDYGLVQNFSFLLL